MNMKNRILNMCLGMVLLLTVLSFTVTGTETNVYEQENFIDMDNFSDNDTADNMTGNLTENITEGFDDNITEDFDDNMTDNMTDNDHNNTNNSTLEDESGAPIYIIIGCIIFVSIFIVFMIYKKKDTIKEKLMPKKDDVQIMEEVKEEEEQEAKEYINTLPLNK